MVLNVDLNMPPRFEDDFIVDNVNTNLELGLPQIEVPNTAVDDDVVISSPRSFEEARNRSRRNRRVTDVRNEDAEPQRGQSARPAATSSRQRRASTRRRNDGGNQQVREDVKKGKGIAMAQEVSQPMPPPKPPTFTCPICMAPFDEEVSTKCGHIFCKQCITAAIAFQGKCPTCRRKLKAKDMWRIYLPNSYN